MRVFSKATIIAATAFILATGASMMFVIAHAESSASARVTQSTEEGFEVECEGNLECEIIGDDTVVATSEDNTTSISATGVTTSLNQSNTIQSGSDFEVIDEQDLGAAIEDMVDRLLDEVSENLANLALFI